MRKGDKGPDIQRLKNSKRRNCPGHSRNGLCSEKYGNWNIDCSNLLRDRWCVCVTSDIVNELLLLVYMLGPLPTIFDFFLVSAFTTAQKSSLYVWPMYVELSTLFRCWWGEHQKTKFSKTRSGALRLRLCTWALDDVKATSILTALQFPYLNRNRIL